MHARSWIISSLLATFLLGACASGPNGTMGFGGLQGERVTLSEARQSAPYPVRVPSETPAGIGRLEEIARMGEGQATQIGMRWADNTVLGYLPTDRPMNYKRVIKIVGAGTLVTVRGVQGYARDAMDTERQSRLPAFLRWYESSLGVELTLTGPHTVSELIQMAESLSF